MDLREAGKQEGWGFSFPLGKDGLLLQSERWNATFTRGSREFHFNGIRVFLGSAAQSCEESFYISKVDHDAIFRPLLKISGKSARTLPAVKVVAVDAGHGGDDSGGASILPYVKEKDVALGISLHLKHLLEEAGFRVVMTREMDEFVPLAGRTEIARAGGADLFISIHLNATESSSVHGTETYVLTPRHNRSTSQSTAADGDGQEYPGNAFDSWNALLGFVVHDQLLKDLETVDRGLKRARFQVLREAGFPAVLVEAGFLTHPGEAERLAGVEYQQRIAGSLVTAVKRYGLMVEHLRSN